MQTNQPKTHKQAPLPFIGQKRGFIRHFIKILNDHIFEDGDDWIIIDAFGGSGLLSHVAKRIKPAAKVIYNDFDDYHKRLQAIPDTNKLRNQIEPILADYPRQKKITGTQRQTVLDVLENFDGVVDMHAVSAWLLFSGKYAKTVDELHKKTLYNTLRRSDYPLTDDYLEGLDVVKMDFEALITPHLNNPKCLLILDPPYICTMQGMYANDNYFGMVEFLRLMRLVRPPFVFFSSTRSELISYLDFVIKYKQEGYQRFLDYQRISINALVNGTAKYEDNLVFKWK